MLKRLICFLVGHLKGRFWPDGFVCKRCGRFVKWMIVLAAVVLAGCSWQGQKHQTFDNQGQLKQNAEWWSMRFCWMSNGIEAYNVTKYWQTGFLMEQ